MLLLGISIEASLLFCERRLHDIAAEFALR
jgi:hypothetical protein